MKSKRFMAALLSPGAVILFCAHAHGAGSDLFGTATAINGDNIAGDVTTNTGFAKEVGEPNHAANGGGASAWYGWTPTTSGVFKIDTAGSNTAGSPLNTLLAVYRDTGATIPVTADSLGESNDVAAATTTSETWVRVVGGTKYYIAVDGSGGAQGDIFLNIAPAVGPANDSFATPSALSGTLPVNSAGNNLNATYEPGEPNPYVDTTVDTGHQGSVWYSFTPAASGVALLNITQAAPSTIRPIWAVYTGLSLGSLTRVPAPGSPFKVNAGTTYFIQVAGGANPGGGNGALGTNQRGSFNLSLTAPTPAQIILVDFGQTWQWLHPLNSFEDPTTDASWLTTWRTPGDATVYNAGINPTQFSAAAPAPFGFGGLGAFPGIVTNVGNPGAGDVNNNAAYFRRTFTLANAAPSLWVRILADDGAFIYIDNDPNGIPINMATGATDQFSTTASAAANATATEDTPKLLFLTPFIPGGTLAAGSHTIAVSIHQNAGTSSDLGFDLQLFEAPPSYGATITPGAGVKVLFEEPGLGATTFTPGAGQTELGWSVTQTAAEAGNPSTRHSLRNEADIINNSNNTPGGNEPFRIGGANPTPNKFFFVRNLGASVPFHTAPVDVNGLASYKVGIKLRAFTTSGTGFEVEDSIRVFLETSDDGVNFVDGGAALELQPLISAGAILPALGPPGGSFNTPNLQYKELRIRPTGNTHKAVRLVVAAVTNSASEDLIWDDISFELVGIKLLPALVGTVTRQTNNNDILGDDTFTFTVNVTAEDNGASTGWVSASDPAHPSGNYGQNVTFGPYPVTGGSKTIVFTDNLDANGTATLVVDPPVALITAGTVSNLARQTGPSLNTVSDDTFSFSMMLVGSNVGVSWTSDAGVNGTYGVPAAFGPFPVSESPKTITFTDVADPTVFRAFTITSPQPGSFIMGDVAIGANPATLLFGAGGATGWRNPQDLMMEMNNGVGVVSTQPVNLAAVGQTTVSFDLRVVDDSTGTNFEADDTFKAEIVETTAGVPATTNLIEPYDILTVNGLMNGAADPPGDEFNPDQIPEAQPFTKVFTINRVVSASVDSITLVFTGDNDAATEHFIIENLHVVGAADPGDSDVDGLLDAWEIQHFGNLAQTAAGDPDGDGQNNGAEQLAGTVPTSGVSALKVVDASRTGNTLTARWQSIVGKNYQFQVSPDLVSGWTPLGAVVSGNPDPGPGPNTGTQEHSETPGGVLPAKYYLRVAVVP